MSSGQTDLVQIAGPIYIGILLNLGLYGMLAAQVGAYWLSYRADNAKFRSLVYGTFLLESLQSVLLMRDGFMTFGLGFGNKDGLQSAHLEWFSVPYITSIVSLVVQCFFGYRLFVGFGRSYWIPILIVTASLTQAIAGIMAGTKDLRFHLYTLLQTKAAVEISVWHIAAVVCDTVIAGSMGYYLHKRDTVFQAHSYIIQIFRLLIETGTITAIATIMNLILFFAKPGMLLFLVPSFIGAKLYANTLMSVVNNRAQIVTGVCHKDTEKIHSPIHFKSAPHVWDEVASTQ